VRRPLFRSAGGLLLIPALWVLSAGPAESAAKDSCHGTSIQFADSPTEAAKTAKKVKKLVFVLHVSGHFEDPKLT
jgi:hypothetical protein